VPLSDIRVLVVCPADHDLTRVALEELPQALADSPFIGYPADTPFFSVMKPAFERVGLAYRPDIHVDSPHHACALVKNGTGFSVVDEISWRASGTERMAVLPLLAEERLTVSLVHLRREPLAQFAQGFVEHLREKLNENGFELFGID
jgi:DNA-binding transcriptional LysR family regulator